MQYVNLFESTPNPVTASHIALGCDYFGARKPEALAMQLLDLYHELGGNMLDTAHIYSQEKPGAVSLSEKVVGKWLAANNVRSKTVLVTKGVHPDRANMQVSRISRQNIRDDFALSLETLGVDYVDIWFLHRDAPQMPVEEIVDMVSDLVPQSQARHIGASNWTAARIIQANEYAKKHNKRQFDISQIQWSFTRSTPESWEDPTIICMNDTELDFYTKTGTPLMAFSPQARGIASKMISQGESAIPKDWVKRFMLKENLTRIEHCRQLSQQTGLTPAAICLAYLTSAPFPTFPVIGPSSPDQLRDSLQTASATLTPAQRASLTSD